MFAIVALTVVIYATATRATESGEPKFTLPTGLFDDKGTAIVWWRPGYGYADQSSVSAIVSTTDNSAFLRSRSIGNVESRDGALTSIKTLSAVANTWYKLVVKWGYLVGGVKKFRIGVDSGSGISWGNEVTFDGSFTIGTHIRLGYNLFSRIHLRQFYLFPDVLSDAKINDWGGTP